MSCPFGNEKLRIEYPCEWSYRVIGLGEEAVRAAVGEVFAGRRYTIVLSRRSRAGKYCSFEVRTIVEGDEDRVGLHHRLGARPGIRIVL